MQSAMLNTLEGLPSQALLRLKARNIRSDKRDMSASPTPWAPFVQNYVINRTHVQLCKRKLDLNEQGFK
jgi:hypothetical protein